MGGWGGQATHNLGRHFAALLGLPLTRLILGGRSTHNLGRHFAALLGLSLTMLILGGWSINIQIGKCHCNFAGITFDNVDPGGLIDTQLGKSHCNFAGITFDNFDPGGVQLPHQGRNVQ